MKNVAQYFSHGTRGIKNVAQDFSYGTCGIKNVTQDFSYRTHGIKNVAQDFSYGTCGMRITDRGTDDTYGTPFKSGMLLGSQDHSKKKYLSSISAVF